MNSISISPQSIFRVVTNLRKFHQECYSDEAEEALVDALASTVTPEIRAELSSKKINYRKEVYESLGTRPVSRNASGISMDYGTLESEHADLVEFGRGPTQGPGQRSAWPEIREWAEDKLGVSTSDAYAIYRSIMKKGHPANPFFFGTITRNEPALFREISRNLKRALHI